MPSCTSWRDLELPEAAAERSIVAPGKALTIPGWFSVVCILKMASGQGCFSKTQPGLSRILRLGALTGSGAACSVKNDIDKRDITVALNSFALEASMMLDARNNWQKLCREAVAEKDPDKLLRIATKINREFDHQQKKQVAAFFENMDKKTA